jgi:glutaconate CoA-transferase subunit B
MAMTENVTIEEIQIARMAREFRGEVNATGATLLAELAVHVAKVLYDDDLVIYGGQSQAAWDSDVAPYLPHDEYLTRHTAKGQQDWTVTFDVVRADKLRIFTGPVQIDRFGNANISVIGDWEHPKVQLIGSRGLPDDLWRVSVLHFHVPSHTPRSIVEKVDFVCSFGYGDTRDALGCNTGWPGVLVTNLGVFTWPRELGEMRIESVHPGVSPEEVRAYTGFPIHIPPSVERTAPPSKEELDVIRNVVDPWGFRYGGDESWRISEAIARNLARRMW